MFEKVQEQIEKGDLKKALKILRSFGKPSELPPRHLLTYFQLSRRLGDFHFGAFQLEKVGPLSPELEIERAFFLGELGATKQAVRLLQGTRGTFSEDFEIQRYLQLGNFLSVLHEYDGALKAYSQMEEFARTRKPVLALVARLNILGHQIYAGQDLKQCSAELLEHAIGTMRAYPLIQQGAFYFLSLASLRLQDTEAAQKFLNQALAVGVEHRMRESLLLEITQFELKPLAFTPAQISALKKKIEAQVHIVYLDQFHKIQGLRYEAQGEVESALNCYLKVIYGGRNNKHQAQARQRYQAIAGIEKIAGWKVEGLQPQTLTPHQIIYNQLEKRRWPLIASKKEDVIFDDESALLAKMTLHLSKNLGFAMRDAEVWEMIWDSPYSFVSSPTVIRTTVSRWRKSRLSTTGEIEQKDLRLRLKLKAGSKLFAK